MNLNIAIGKILSGGCKRTPQSENSGSPNRNEDHEDQNLDHGKHRGGGTPPPSDDGDNTESDNSSSKSSKSRKSKKEWVKPIQPNVYDGCAELHPFTLYIHQVVDYVKTGNVAKYHHVIVAGRFLSSKASKYYISQVVATASE
jgi:hypothetical protein